MNHFQRNPLRVDIKHFHLFCGLGGGAAGFNKGHARVGNAEASFRCLGGIDNDPASIRDFKKLSGVSGTVLDLFNREQYAAFHGREPAPDWTEATPDDIRAAAGGEYPNIIFLSAPCKGFSGLLSQAKSGTDKYQALNGLTLRGVWLALESFKDDPPELFVFENVPRIATRGRHLLDQIVALLRHYGYAVAETTHDCGELGGLAQSRRRFLLVARHQAKVPAFLYEPVKRPLLPVGAILGRMPLPGDAAGGPMHRIPRLQWKTWVRLAFVEAGSDWRSLNKLAVEEGYLRDFLIVPEYRSGFLGVRNWNEPSGTVAGQSLPTNGAFSIADPRMPGEHDYGQYGVLPWESPTGVISAQSAPGGGHYSVADPRPKGQIHGKYAVVPWEKHTGTVISGSTTGQGAFAVSDPRHEGPAKHSNEFRIVPFDQNCQAVTSAHGTGQCVADPRPPEGKLFGKYAVTRWDSKTGTEIGGDDSGAYAVADPRANCDRSDPYGVIPWTSSAGAVASSGRYDNGRFSVADPRTGAETQTELNACLPAAREKLVAVIRSLDGTWHRPFTTLELAALQGLVDPEEHLELEGLSDSDWRERIGNAVPPPSATAIASMMGEAILLSRAGETFQLSSAPIWVRPIAIAISVAQGAA